MISIASGKGGTGKTTVSAALTKIWDDPVTAVDLDVEEPNLHLFLKPDIQSEEAVCLVIPVLDPARCNLCGICSDFCQFGAIAVMGESVMTFPEMCHGCGGCMALCPEKALSPGKRELGVIMEGRTPEGRFLMGRLRVGEAMSPPLIRAVKKRLANRVRHDPCDIIVDAPPGVSCPAIAAVMDTDFVVLVAEATPFGFHDFRLAVEAFTGIGVPMGVVINGAGIEDDTVKAFCREKGLPVLAEIPWKREIAEGYARGKVISTISEELRDLFVNLKVQLRKRVVAEKVSSYA